MAICWGSYNSGVLLGHEVGLQDLFHSVILKFEGPSNRGKLTDIFPALLKNCEWEERELAKHFPNTIWEPILSICK